jgi:hypothetical protein
VIKLQRLLRSWPQRSSSRIDPDNSLPKRANVSWRITYGLSRRSRLKRQSVTRRPPTPPKSPWSGDTEALGNLGARQREAQAVYESLGFRAQPEFWSVVVGSWLDNDANR